MDSPSDASGNLGMNEMSFVARGLGIATVAAAAALGGLSGAMAADPAVAPMFGGPPPAAPGMGFAPPADDMPVTFATGWYLRGDLGMSNDVRIPIGGASLPHSGGFPNNWGLGVGAGYKFNDWMRTDVTLDYRAPKSFSGNTSLSGCIAPSGTIVNGVQVLTLEPCADTLDARVRNMAMLANVYGELGTWAGITPYVGAGVGFGIVRQNYAQSWFLLNPTPANAGATAGLTQSRTWTSAQLAWALMAGVAYAVTPNLAIDIGGRYLNMGSVRTYSNMYGVQSTHANVAKEIRIGFRYTPD